MATIKLNRPSNIGLHALNRALYELTGKQYYLLPLCEQCFKPNVIELFWLRKRELKEKVKEYGGIFTHKLCRIDGTIIPFIYNSLEF